jgi:ankyrin repeat protein
MSGFKESSFDVVVTVLPAVVSWGDHFLIQDIISAGADVNAPAYPKGETALVVAIRRGDARIVELLINAGADVNANAALFYGPTALEIASRNNDLRMVQFLLGLGADPDEWSLTEAISGSVELVNTLLTARLDRYRRYSNGYGCRALQHAINTKNVYMVNTLLTKGIDANAIIQPGFGDEVESNSLRDRPTIVFGVSALGYAIQKDNSDDLWTVQALLNSGADPNSIVTNSFDSFKGLETRTALLEAINSNNLATVKKLITEGANVNPGARGDIISTPLQAAAKKGSIDIVSLLLEHGADVNAPPHYRHGATALQFAAIGGYAGIALLLLEKGADVNALPAQIDGRTALEGAAEHGRKDMVRILLIARAQTIGIGGEQYERALKFASKNGQDATCRLLEKYKEQSWESLVDWDAK